MLPFVAGTVRDRVEMAAMDSKWQQRKKEITKSLKEKYGNTEKTRSAIQYLQYQVELEQNRESNYQSGISAKIQSGAPLTPEEIEYLKKNNPKMYQAYEEAKKEEKAYEKQLENCDTKEDVEKLEHVKMGEFLAQLKEVANNPDIPEGEKLAQIEKIHAKAKMVQKVHNRFVRSSAYASLPTEREKELEEQDGNSSEKRADGDIVIEKQEQADADLLYMDGDGNYVKREDAGLEGDIDRGNPENASEKVHYHDVADAVKEFVVNNRPTGAGLEILLDIEGEYRKEREAGFLG